MFPILYANIAAIIHIIHPFNVIVESQNPDIPIEFVDIINAIVTIIIITPAIVLKRTILITMSTSLILVVLILFYSKFKKCQSNEISQKN